MTLANVGEVFETEIDMTRGLFYLIYLTFLLGILGVSPAKASISKKPKISSQSSTEKLSLSRQKAKAKKFMKESSAFRRLNTKKMKAVVFPEKIETNELQTKDYVKFVPGNLQNSSSEAYVANRFGDTVLQNFLDSPQVRNSPMGQTATKVESAMKTEVNLNGAPSKEKGNVSAAPATEHKISFQVLALQAQTKMEYKGWTHATVKHDARAKETGVEISEKIWHNKDLVISHTKTNVEDRSNLGVRWSW